MEVSGFILREEGDFYYLDLRPSEAEAEGELRSREESVSGSRRKLHRQSRIQQLSPVKEASTPVQAELTSQTSLDSTIDSTLGSEDSSLDMVDINMWEGEDVSRVSARSSLATNFDLAASFPPAQDPKPDDQGDEKTCTRHALAKAICAFCMKIGVDPRGPLSS